MFWKEDKKEENNLSSESIHLSFNIDTPSLPVDHIEELSKIILAKATYLQKEECVGIHEIHGAESGNGWERSTNNNDIIYPSKRSKCIIQTPKSLKEQIISDLNGYSAKIFGQTLTFSKPKAKIIPKHGTIFARYLINSQETEDDFLKETHQELLDMGVTANKMMCGKSHTVKIAGKQLKTTSLMLVDLKIPDAMKILSCGIGNYKLFGCGLFLPHKSVTNIAIKYDD